MTETPTNGRPGWKDVLQAVETSEHRVLQEVRKNQSKIDRLERYNQEHPVAAVPVEGPVVDALDARVDELEGKFDHVEGQVSVMKVISSTIAAVVVIGLTAIGVLVAAGV